VFARCSGRVFCHADGTDRGIQAVRDAAGWVIAAETDAYARDGGV